ncbi:MAG: undecaprenyl-diphosphate phosphatase [Pedosphaera sp.]|nr:undecaprenyl-diphosphate phosphatase [Pedosphaera sp.]
MVEWVRIVILGIVEGITEFLPISSTGHLLLTEALFRHAQSELFNTVIQVGAVLAVIIVFGARVKTLAFGWQQPTNRDHLAKLGAAFLITAVGGLLLKSCGWKPPHSAVPVAWATLIGGILFVVIEQWLRGKERTAGISWSVAVAVGFAQLFAAVFPGASRSGTTILIALLLGVNRARAAEFSFLLGIPTLVAAGGKEIVDALRTHAPHEPWLQLAVAAMVAATTASFAVRWLLRYIQTHDFSFFGWYRIAVGSAMLLLAFRGIIH